MSDIKQFERGGYQFQVRIGAEGYPLLEMFTVGDSGPIWFQNKQWHTTSISKAEVMSAADKLMEDRRKQKEYSEREPQRREETQKTIDDLDL